MGYNKSSEDSAYFLKFLRMEIENNFSRYASEHLLEDRTNMTIEEVNAVADAYCFPGEDIIIRKFLAWLFRFGFELNKLPGFDRFWEKEKE